MIRITSEFGQYLGGDIANAITWILGWYFAALPFLKSVSFFVCAVLVWGIFYSITTSGYLDYTSDLRSDRRGGKNTVSQKMRRKWKAALLKIQNRNDRTKWVTALKDVESVAQEAFRIKGYGALNDSDRSRIAYEAGEYATLPELKEAQTAYKKAKNEDIPFTHEEAVAALRAYKKFIRETEILGKGFL
ncbi:MAG: hypothetical protein EXS60_00075 [Candidatus Pacebacteria bacterium]|nr:hypothetical protein [Candidatus Paceibacterota bacterium]